MARIELKDVSLPTRERANAIIDRVCQYYGFSRHRIVTERYTSREISWVRHVCVWAVAHELDFAWTVMSAIFQRDHSTLVASSAAVDFEIDTETNRGKLAATKPWDVE